MHNLKWNQLKPKGVYFEDPDRTVTGTIEVNGEQTPVQFDVDTHEDGTVSWALSIMGKWDGFPATEEESDSVEDFMEVLFNYQEEGICLEEEEDGNGWYIC